MSNGWQLFVEWVLAHLTDLQISAGQGVATLFWWFAKLANAIATFLVQEDLWNLIVRNLLNVIEATMPTLYGSLIFSGTGVFYIALMLAGILLIIGYGDAQFAEPSQVILWGILTLTLFVSSVPTVRGYDLIQFFESARRWTATQPAFVMSSSGELSDLITVPMRATLAEATDLSFNLPNQFVNEFFYEPSAADMETHTGVFLDTWLTGQVTLDFQFERADRQEARRQAAWNGILLSALTLAPALLEMFFGIIFATIAAAVLVIIILFLACVPLGFFSFGKDILTAIIKQYFVLWGLTLASGIAIGALLGAGQLFLPNNPTIVAVVLYLPALIVVGIAVSFLLSLSYRTMLGTFGMLTATLRATITRDAQNSRLPQGGEVPLTGSIKRALDAAQNVAGLTVIGTTAAMSGGAVLPALAGGILSRADSRTGRDAALLARITSDSPAARTFSAAAMTPYTLPSAVAVYAVNRHQSNQSTPRSDRVANVFALQPNDAQTAQTGQPTTPASAGTQAATAATSTQPISPNVVYRQSPNGNNDATQSSPSTQTTVTSNNISLQQFASFSEIVRDGLRETARTQADALDIVAARLATHPTLVHTPDETRRNFATFLLAQEGVSAETKIQTPTAIPISPSAATQLSINSEESPS